MRNLLSLIGLAVVVFLGLGYYLGWYKFDLSKGSDGNTKVQFDINTNKITDDSKKGLEKGSEKLGEFVNGLKKESTPKTNDVTIPTPGGTTGTPSATNVPPIPGPGR